MQSKKSQSIALAIGILLFIASWVLAYAGFKHFYELLILGLFLVLLPFSVKHFGKRLMVLLFFVFVLAGIIGDLLGGLALFELWRYNYAHLWEYILLYVWVYPIAGIVMVQSYTVITEILQKRFWKNTVKATTKQILITSVIIYAILVVGALLSLSDTQIIINVVLYVGLSIGVFLTFSLLSAKQEGRSLTADLIAFPVAAVSSLLLAVYINAFLHELPNVAAKQWQYLTGDTPAILGIPDNVLVGWPILLLVPLSLFYFVKGLPYLNR